MCDGQAHAIDADTRARLQARQRQGTEFDLEALISALMGGGTDATDLLDQASEHDVETSMTDTPESGVSA
jgi:hypothetical protein